MTQYFGLSLALQDIAMESSLALYVINAGIHWSRNNNAFNGKPDAIVPVYLAMNSSDVHKYETSEFFAEHTNKYLSNTLIMQYDQLEFTFNDKPHLVDINTLKDYNLAHFHWISPANQLPNLGDIIETYHSDCGGRVETIQMTEENLNSFICFWESKGCKAWRNIQLPDGSKFVIFDPTGDMASKDTPY